MPQSAPPFHLPDDCEFLNLPFGIASGRTLASGENANQRLRIVLYRRRSDGRVLGQVWFGDGSEGPPLHAHGGAIAYILDEAMGSAAWAADYPVVASELKFIYHEMTPLYSDHHIETEVVAADAANVTVRAALRFRDGRLAVEAEGQFHILKKDQIEPLIRKVSQAVIAEELKRLSPHLKWA